MDLVYIVKESEENLDLKYSLRSLVNVTGYDRVFMAGFKPSWVANSVIWIPTTQAENKWENALNNLLTACKCKNVSDDFIVMNDDFFAIHPVNLETDINLYRNTLDEAIESYRRKVRTRWIKAHTQVKELLESMGSEHFMNFELHIPMIINKQKFLKIFRDIKVCMKLKEHGIVLYRSLYGNLNWSNPQSREGRDCKPAKNKDAQDYMLEWQWLSVFDGVTSNLDKFPKIKSALLPFMDKKSIFEK